MKAEELRIGNWISYDGRNCTIQEPTDLVDSDEFDPIPLTEDWLAKAGFKRDGHFHINASTNQMRPLKLLISPSDFVKKGWYISLWDEDNETVIYEGKDYFLHQLQNLYFALTQTELIIKP